MAVTAAAAAALGFWGKIGDILWDLMTGPFREKTSPLTANAVVATDAYTADWYSFAPLDLPLHKTPVTRDTAVIHDWVAIFGALDAYRTTSRLILQAGPDNAVVVTDIYAKVIDRSSRKPGHIVGVSPEGVVEDITLGLNLDIDHGRALFLDPESPDYPDWQPFFSDKTISLLPGESQSFMVCGYVSKSQIVTWRIAVNCLLDGQKKTLSTPEEDPFVTVGTEGVPSTYQWDWLSDETPHWQYSATEGNLTNGLSLGIPFSLQQAVEVNVPPATL